MSKDKGTAYENLAAKYLRQQGLRILSQNYHSKAGEIDLIAKTKDSLVFVEVKYRRSNAFGGAAEQVTASKMNKIRRCAEAYIQRYHIDSPCRFDVIAISGDKTPEINWIKNAF